MNTADPVNSQRYWDNRFRTDWEEFSGREQSRFFAVVALELLPGWLKDEIRSRPLSVCDWGCALGDGTEVLRTRLLPGSIVGVDFSKTAIEKAAALYPEVRFLAEDWLQGKPPAKPPFDIVFSSNTLEHFADPQEVLRAISTRAQCAVAILVPFEELDRHPEHFFTFDEDNILLSPDGDLVLVHAMIADTSTRNDTHWAGKQICLVYGRPRWIGERRLSLSNCSMRERFQDIETIGRMMAQVAERDGTCPQLSQALSMCESQLGSASQLLSEREQRLDAQLEVVAARAARIEILERSLEELTRKQAELAAAVKDREAAISTMQGTLEEKGRRTDALAKAVAECEQVVTSRNRILETRDQEIASLRAALAEGNSRESGLASAVAERDGRIEGLLRELAGREDQIAALSATVQEKDGAIIQLTQGEASEREKGATVYRALLAKEDEIEALGAALSKRDARIASALAELEAIRAAAALWREGAQELQRVKGSRSWRLMNYLWSAKRLFGGANLRDRASRQDIAPPVLGAHLSSGLVAAGHAADSDRGASDASRFGLVTLPVIEWAFRFQRPQQIARRFARAGHPVFYLKLSFGDTLQSGPIERGVTEVRLPGDPSTVVYQSMPTEAHARAMAEALLTALPKDRMWVTVVQLPFWWPVARILRDLAGYKVVYDCMDDHAGFSTNGEEMLRAEDELMHGADIVVVSSALLLEKVAAKARKTALIRNGVDYPHFATVPDSRPDRTERPFTIGYYGAIADWFDSALVGEIAALRPEWEIVLIGHTFSADLGPFEERPNIRLTGEKPYSELPALIAPWDCCIIPFKRIPLTEATNPVKVYEMLAAGKPVVAVPLPELRPIAGEGHISLAEQAAEFVESIERVVAEDSELRRSGRRAFALQNTWEIRQHDLARAILELQEI